MKPPAPDVLKIVAAHLSQRAATLSDPELAGELMSAGNGLSMIAADYDGCAARRVEDIAALAGLIRRGITIAGDALELGAVDDDAHADLHISALDRRLCRLHDQIVIVQAWLEGRSDEDARQLLRDILAFQRATAERSALLRGT